MWRRPERTTLTLWRMGPVAHPRWVRIGPVPGGDHQRLTLADEGGSGPGLGPGPLLDHHELAACVVDAGLVEADHHLQGEHEVPVEVAVQGVPAPRAVAQDQRRGPLLSGGVTLLEPLLEVGRATVPAGRAARPTPGRSGSRCGQKAARNSTTRSGRGWSKYRYWPSPKRYRAMSMVARNRSSLS